MPRKIGLIAALPGILAIALVVTTIALSLGPAQAQDPLGQGLLVLTELSVPLAVVFLRGAG